MKRLIVLGILLIMALGCVETSNTRGMQISKPNPNGSDYTITAQPSDSSTLTNEPPQDRTWISPGKVNIGNYYPGATADWVMTIHNGKPIPAQFAIGYRNPDYTAEGYTKPLLATEDWVIIADETPILAPYETREVGVTLKIPYGVKAVPAKWEYWISVIDKTQKGNVNTELCSRWLVDMR